MNCRQIVCSDPVSVDLQHRSATIRAAAAAGDLVALTFSSEAPVERYGGMEILSHAPGAVDLSRLNDGAPLLYCHDPQKVIGIVEKATISGKRGHATIRWGTSALATEVRADVAAGVIRNVSVGYRVIDTEPAGDGAYRVTKWEPLEISLLGLAADQTIGIGRSLTPATPSPMTRTTSATEAQADNGAALATIAETVGRLVEKIDSLERRSLQQATPAQRSVPIAGAAPMSDFGHLDMTRQEEQSYSLVRAIRAAATGDWSKAGFERECSRALAQQEGRDPRGFFVPVGNLAIASRGYEVGTASLGGNLVPTELQAESFIDALRNRAVVGEMGARMLPGLTGHAPIPRRTGVTNTYWVSEGQPVTPSTGTFDNVNLTAKTLGALSSYTRLAQLQTTPQIEMLVRDDMAAQIALAIDLAALAGTGTSSQPLGILNTSGVGSVVGGANGAALDFDHLAKLKGSVAIDNADLATAGYVMNAKCETQVTTLKDSQGNYLLGPAAMTAGTPGGFWGRRALVSNQLPSNLSKGTSTGVCSAVVYGNFSDLLVGMWGSLDILVNPFGSGYAAGDVEIRALQTVDIAVRHPESFAIMLDALTP